MHKPPPPPPSLVRQVMAAMLQYQSFVPSLHPSPAFHGWTTDEVRDVIGSIPRFFFLSPRSIGRQNTSRRRAPLKPRNLRQEAKNSRLGFRLGGPAAFRDPAKVMLGVDKALEFYSWVESNCGFVHSERTCREMALVLAKANRIEKLWQFLKSNEPIVSTQTLTSIVKVLGEEGLSVEAMAAFYRMRQLHCKPDVQCYNTLISALCQVGDSKKARDLLQQMELPGARCPPDTFTYTILISFYCKRSIQTGCKKAIRRRLWEANHMFRHMIFKGFVPDVVTYNCLIDGLCKCYRIGRALELFDDMLVKGCLPNRVTYNSFIRYYSAVNEVDKAVEMMRVMVSRNHGVPTSSSYTPIVHALCETGRVKEARDLLMEMVCGGSIPREFTFKLVCDALSHEGQVGLPEELHRRIRDGMDARFRHLMRVKPVMIDKLKLPQ